MQKTTAMAVHQQLRRLAGNQARNARAYSTYYPKAPTAPTKESNRSIHTTKAMNARSDSSTIDFAYMPNMDFDIPAQVDHMRMPLLPTSYSPVRATNDEDFEHVMRPEISTVSANGTHIDSPSAMSEVTDNQALEMDVFDLTKKVTNAAALKLTGMSVQDLKEPGLASQFLGGLLDDMFGPKRAA